MFFKLYAIALLCFTLLDGVWLGLVAPQFYRQQIGHLMTDSVKWPAAILFYLLFLIGLVAFVIAPALEKHSWVHALAFGALFGLITYATYDLTNLATLKNWPLLVTIVDMTWGATLSATVATATYWIANKLLS
jgi:uncharacterized membrane protein